MKKIALLVWCATFSYTIHAQTFTLKSNDLGGQATMQQVFNGMSCVGENKSPQLYWENPPAGTKSFAITMYDEDAPTGSGWWHWLMFNIDKNEKQIPTNAGNISLNIAPKNAVQSITDFGVAGYGGPCPPQGHGFHKYTITVYALQVENLGLNATTNPAVVGFYLGHNTIEKASLVLYYKR